MISEEAKRYLPPNTPDWILAIIEGSPHGGWFVSFEITEGHPLIDGWRCLYCHDPFDAGEGRAFVQPYHGTDSETGEHFAKWTATHLGCMAEALELTDPSLILEEIKARKKLREQMVGDLYPNIVVDQVGQLVLRYDELLAGALGIPRPKMKVLAIEETFKISGRGYVHVVTSPAGEAIPKLGEAIELDGKAVEIHGIEMRRPIQDTKAAEISLGLILKGNPEPWT